MDISIRTTSHGVESTNKVEWVRIKGRPAGSDVGLVVGTQQVDLVGHCSRVLFEETGEVGTFRSTNLATIPPPA